MQITNVKVCLHWSRPSQGKRTMTGRGYLLLSLVREVWEELKKGEGEITLKLAKANPATQHFSKHWWARGKEKRMEIVENEGV